jgi:predicted  nucleic acid-binding Zn-ribbon protein
MTEREKLEREIYQLTRIINSNRDALVCGVTRPEDRPALQQQIDIRAARRDELQCQLDALST